MPKKTKIQYVCSSCGAGYSVWAGKCAQCGEWNTLQEQLAISGNSVRDSGDKLKTFDLSTLQATKPQPRLDTGIVDVNAVLGGGIVSGSVVLLTGQPGIGKSTLVLQLANTLGEKSRVLYVSGEESSEQIALRARRLNVVADKLSIATTTVANDIATTIASREADVVIIDSVQTLTCNEISSAAGTVSQITNSTQLLTAAAKATSTAIVIVGHVTKEGSIAGPKLLEHMVDVVLQLEGDRYGGFKVLRAIKNRFGSTTEASIFEMQENGLKIVDNPSAALLAERQISDGSIVLSTLEGSRPLLVEVQALVNKTSYGYPKRASSGFDLNRLNLLVAVLERRTKLELSDKDIYINIVGGIRLNDPAADLAVCMAIGSAAKGLKLKTDAVVFGEVGLSGEIRHVISVDKRLKEAEKLGFRLAVGPRTKVVGKVLHSVADLREALNTFLS